MTKSGIKHECHTRTKLIKWEIRDWEAERKKWKLKRKRRVSGRGRGRETEKGERAVLTSFQRVGPAGSTTFSQVWVLWVRPTPGYKNQTQAFVSYEKNRDSDMRIGLEFRAMRNEYWNLINIPNDNSKLFFF